ncbi:MAG TPA: 30S ribosomal protein S9 [Gemmatimonadota bacterium]|jgi:small subunit ribosomal protein S9|nr:30S ribosomal protein S9 [Gemmatimonadota bacterium]
MAKQFNGVGRRKTSVARVYLRPGKGAWEINGRPLVEYFPRLLHAQQCQKPFEVTRTDNQYDVNVNVNGGGPTGQAGAIQLAIARALVTADDAYRAALKSEGLLTRDPRMVERKKYGRPKARKRFQFSKR